MPAFNLSRLTILRFGEKDWIWRVVSSLFVVHSTEKADLGRDSSHCSSQARMNAVRALGVESSSLD